MTETSRQHSLVRDNQNKACWKSFGCSQMHGEDLLSSKDVRHQPAKPPGKKIVLTNWIIQPLDDFSAVCLVGRRLSASQNEEYWHSSAIVKRISAQRFETASGSIYILEGCINAQDARMEAGFSWNMIKTFKHGFPEDWKLFIDKYLVVQKERWNSSTGKSTSLHDEQMDCLTSSAMNELPSKVAERTSDTVMKLIERDIRLITPCAIHLYTLQPKQLGERQDGRSNTENNFSTRTKRKRDPLEKPLRSQEWSAQSVLESHKCSINDKKVKHSVVVLDKICVKSLTMDPLQEFPPCLNMSRESQENNPSALMGVRTRGDTEENPVNPGKFANKEKTLTSESSVSKQRINLKQKRGKGNYHATSIMRRHASVESFNKENADKAWLERKGVKKAMLLQSETVTHSKDDHKHRSLRGKPSSKTQKFKTQKKGFKETKSKTRGTSRKIKSSSTRRKRESTTEWSKEELARLYSVVDSFPKKKSILWNQVSDAVGCRTADDCKKRYKMGSKLLPISRFTSEATKVSGKLQEKENETVRITARVGTLKRKRQVHEYLDHLAKDDYSDPFASGASPIYVGKKIVIPSVSAMKTDDLGHLQTPGAATPKSPLSMSFGVLANNHISPGMLEPVHRKDADRYIFQMQRSKVGCNWGNLNLKKVCKDDSHKRTTTPINHFTTERAAVPTLASNGILIEDNILPNSLDKDSDEEEDYYFSE
ncbi:mis18-binding protein 1-like isoform X3 [Lethenteron reissneri]|uniref:mis18-binding protein 1-like isoform X3 n=1 Tax=Lethenteron reissneri TaxID=7753 RepID=UPI002AB616C9|nr:mis18-binding protein 1-like isoform X3 [Lethenteron reissneri]